MRPALVPLLLALAAGSSARAEEPEIPEEGLSTATTVLLGGHYAYGVDPLPNDHRHEVLGDLRARVALGGPRVGYLLGLDGSLGGSDTGLVVDLDVHLVGAAVRWRLGMIGLSTGLGVGVVRGSLPLSARIPLEVFVDAAAGPVRLLATFTMRLSLASDAQDVTLGDFADDLGASLHVRFGREHRYWGDTVAGAGPALGLTYRERSGGRMVGVALALALSGAN